MLNWIDAIIEHWGELSAAATLLVGIITTIALTARGQRPPGPPGALAIALSFFLAGCAGSKPPVEALAKCAVAAPRTLASELKRGVLRDSIFSPLASTRLMKRIYGLISRFGRKAVQCALEELADELGAEASTAVQPMSEDGPSREAIARDRCLDALKRLE